MSNDRYAGQDCDSCGIDKPVETSHSESALNEGLALMLDNILKGIDSFMDEVKPNCDPLYFKTMESSLIVLKTAFKQEAYRLRQKG